MRATQIDFALVILNAVCQWSIGGHGVCDSYPDSPTEVPNN
ncbi:hypothetical protein ROA7745_03262 [Roseovarius aestuarii]|uniref:Uncharacterized protein n=1 Tax=Roseovarius aestuarii TaxID=475083 RepID=A0A1X7BV98_9RHOB|nr:hypothetical protein ROA7745_03262 [Roseovarius aestuarii]